MTQFIKKLQQKPEPVKHVIMWAGIILIMVLILIFWILTFPSQIPNTAESDATTNLKKELPTAFNGLKSQAGEFFNLFK